MMRWSGDGAAIPGIFLGAAVPSACCSTSAGEHPSMAATRKRSSTTASEDEAHALPGEGRKAHGVDAAGRERNLTRLRRVEGQIRGLQKMVEEDRYCADILMQIASVHEALRGVGRELMRNHLRHCATHAIRTGDETAEGMYDELIDMMYKHAR